MSSAAASAPRPRLSRRAAVLVALVLLLGTALIVPVRQILSQRGQLADLERRVETLVTERDELAGEVAKFEDPAYLERIARRCLGMVRPGEIAIVTVPEDGSEPITRC